MPGRAKSKPYVKRLRTAPAPLDVPAPRPHPLSVNTDRTVPVLQRMRNDETIRAPIKLSEAYRKALAMPAVEADIEDPDKVRAAVLKGLREASNGHPLKIADLLAASLVRRAVDPASRDAVLALREIADRTEGPVVQQVQSASVRYVVSVTPAGAVGAPTIVGSSPEEWERMARADFDAAQAPALPPGTRGDEA